MDEAGQKKKHSPLLFSFDSSLSFWRRKLVDFQFLSHSLNTEFEHKSMNTGGLLLAVEMRSRRGVVFRFVFKAKEKAATIELVTA